MIETKRLNMHAASRGEMELFIVQAPVPEPETACGEMLQGCLEHPDAWD